MTYQKVHIRDVHIQKPKMKKYYQLALALVCMVSVVTLLFYRHEYYRLRYVLEVLNFFGKPGVIDPNDCFSANFTLHSSNRPSFSNPLPSWQRLSDTHFIYSAHWEDTENSHRVNAISIGLEETNLKFDCQLWYDSNEEPMVGKFGFSKITKDPKNKDPSEATMVAYDLYCKQTVKEIAGSPYAVSFSKTMNTIREEAFIPVFNPALSTQNMTTICIAPTSKPNIQKSEVVEFLSYHQLIGVSEFVIYNSGSISRLESKLSLYSLHDKLGLSLTFLPWNFPFPNAQPDISQSVVEYDCLLRTKGRARSVVMLGWDEYIVPKYHNNLSAMLDDLGKSASMFRLSSLTFCTQVPDNIRSTKTDLLFLRKTHYVSDSDHLTHIYQPGQVGGATQRILPGIAVIHRYSKCTSSYLTIAQDNSDTAMFRFSSDLSQSNLIKFWNSGKLFDN